MACPPSDSTGHAADEQAVLGVPLPQTRHSAAVGAAMRNRANNFTGYRINLEARFEGSHPAACLE